MLRRKVGSGLAACGIIMLMFGLSALPALGAEPTQVRMAPSPRPALAPVTNSSGANVQTGHITGTIINVSTGAPSAGIAVNVGGVVVQSDVNGNYDRWVPVGNYTVTLVLATEQGTPAQDVMTVAVEPNAATVQHLNFRGQKPAPVAPVVAAPAVATPAPTAPAAPAGAAPKRLPRTGSAGSGPWIWLAFGAALLLAGGLVGFGPVMGGRSPALVLRAHAANSALLRTLLAAPMRPTPARATSENDDLLAALLQRDGRER
jgi:hypothetical protein